MGKKGRKEERKKERERVLRAPIPISCGTNLAKNTTGAQVQLEREREMRDEDEDKTTDIVDLILS
jgi:hypothetical protein